MSMEDSDHDGADEHLTKRRKVGPIGQAMSPGVVDEENGYSLGEHGVEDYGSEVEEKDDGLGELAGGGSGGALGKSKRNKFAAAGILKSITLRRFWNHEHFHMKFFKNLNFIHGKNGSGKSALLLGIQTALGAKKDRASLKDLIMGGKNDGEVKLVLWNEGSDAFMPEIFGGEITFIKKLKLYGSATLQVLTAKGQKPPGKTPKIWQEKILEHFAIEVNNPCVLMGQETSKTFLQGSDEFKKYEFFMQATCLQSTMDQIASARESTAKMANNLEAMKPVLDKKEQERKKWEDLDREFGKSTQYKTQIKNLEEEQAWAQLAIAEKGIRQLELDIQQLQGKQTKYERNIADKEQELITLQEENKELESAEKAKSAEHKEVIERFKAAKEAAKEQKRRIKEFNKTSDTAGQRLANSKSELKKAQKKHEELCKSLQRDVAAEEGKKQQVIQDKEKRKELKKGEIEAANRKIQELNGRDKELKDELSSQHQEQQRLNREVRMAKEYWEQITAEKKQKNPSSGIRYGGNNMLQVINEVKQSRWKGNAPVGPLGNFIKLKPSFEEVWRPAVDSLLMRKSRDWIVEEHQDLRQLRQIFGKHHVPIPNIMVMKKSRRHDIPPANLGERAVNDVIEIADDWVFNAVIDSVNIERRFLIEDRSASKDGTTCMEFLRRLNRQDQQKVASVISQNCFVASRYIGSTTFETQNLEMARHPILELAAERDDPVNEGKRDRQIQKAKEEYDRVTRSHRQGVAEISRLKKNITTVARSVFKLESSIPKLEGEIEYLERELRGLQQESSSHLEGTVEAEVEEMKEKIDRTQHEILERDDTFQKAKKKLDEEKKQWDQLKEAEKKLTEEVNRIADEMNAIDDKMHGQTELAVIKVKINKYQEKKSLCETAIKEKDRKFKGDKQNLEANTNIVKDITQKVYENPRSFEKLVDIIRRLRQKIEEHSKRIGMSHEEVRKNCSDAKIDLYKFRKEYEKTLSNHMELDSTSGERELEFKRFRKRMSKNTSQTFQLFLAEQNHFGELKFDHENMKLDMQVQANKPNAVFEMSQEEAGPVLGKGGKSLSGGERSYTTLCFALALGEVMESPFRVMDEFDVYMDTVNRRIALKKLMETCTNFKNRQFFLLTPKDIPRGIRGEEQGVHKLPDPERSGNQRRLNGDGSLQA